MSDREEIPNRESRICMALMRLGTRMASQFDTWFATYGITQAQFRLLLAVWNKGGQDGITPSALADHLLIERPTATALIARLVNAGFLIRVPDPEDRRSHHVRLTVKGGDVLQTIGPQAIARAMYTQSVFTPEEQEDFEQLLSRLEIHLRTGDFH